MAAFRTKNPRTIFIGDVHGCLDELKSLLDILDVGSQDRVIFLGDIINRGPAPAETVHFIKRAGFESILGNHEASYFSRLDASPRYQQFRKDLGEEAHRWLADRPLFIETDRFLAVHGGLEPYKHPSESSPEIIQNIRTWDGKGKDLKSDKNPPWYEFYHGEKPVIYGHWASEGLTIRKNTIGLDSGCVYGNSLSAFILETGQIYQVMAKRVYQQTGT